MTKRIKRFCIIGLTAIGFLCAALLLFMPKFAAFADLQDKNGQFKMEGSSYLSTRVKDEGEYTASDFKFGFKINKIKPQYTDVRNELTPFWDWLDNPYYQYSVEVWRKNTVGEDTKLLTEGIKYAKTRGGNTVVSFVRQKHVYYTENIEFAERFIRAEGKKPESYSDDTEFYVYESKTTGNIPFSTETGGLTDTTPFIMINIIPDGVNSEYYIKFRYEIFRYTSNGMFSNYTETISGEMESDKQSLYAKLSEWQTLGVLQERLPEGAYAFADKVLNNRTKEKISVKYLEQIEGTPFATMKTVSAEAYAINGVVGREDIASALGRSTFDCIGSYCDGFNKEGNVYTAHYFAGKYLKARTVDGNEDTIYLDINNSYADFYKPYVDMGLMDKGAFEVTFSENVYGGYKEKLAGYSPATIHGYFAFTVIPKSRTLNALFADIFNVGTSKAGAVYGLDYGVSLSMSDYQKLLDDFHYSYLKRVWNGFMDLLELGADNANVYVMYVRPETKTTFVNENGSDDEDGKGGAIKVGIKNFWDNTGGKFLKFIGDGWNTLTGFINGLSGTWKVVLAVAIIAAVVVLLVAYAKYSKKR